MTPVLMDSILLLPEDIDALQGRKDLHDDLRRGWHVKAMLAQMAQHRIAQVFTAGDPVDHPVLGELQLVVDPWLYEEMRRRHGADCWKDKRFRREFAADNPAAKIRSRRRRTTIARP